MLPISECIHAKNYPTCDDDRDISSLGESFPISLKLGKSLNVMLKTMLRSLLAGVGSITTISTATSDDGFPWSNSG